MAAPFSSSDEAIINEVIPLSELTLSSSSKAQNVDVETLYDIRRVAQLLLKHRFRRVALQFPDELLCDASAVFWTLESALKRAAREPSSSTANGEAQPIELYVLADTSYGNCCVDEVAAEHVDADVVVHFGHACLSPTSRLPCIYVFHKLPIDVADCAQRLVDTLSSQSYDEQKRLVLTYDVGYEHASEQIRSALQKKLQRDVYLSQMDQDVNWTRYINGTDNEAEGEADRMAVTRKNILPDDVSHSDVVFLYIGPESLALTNLLLKLGPSTHLIRYDATAQEARVDNGQTNKLLQRRYAAVQKARDAQTVGILVGTLGIRLYLPLLQHLRTHLTETQGKRVYTISVGKLNPAKLANFQEIDVFVLIACPENSALGAHNSSRDFFRPIVTPFELLTAFKGRQWTGEYELDLERVFEQVQAADQQRQGGSDEEEDEDIPHFSLVTGGLVSSRRKQKEEAEDEGDGPQGAALQRHSNGEEAGVVTVRSADGSLTRVMDSAGAAHLSTRSWRGLEQRLGMDEPAPLETGRTGIAKGYSSGAEVRQEGSTN